MIFGIGADVVEVPRVEQILARHGARFAERILNFLYYLPVADYAARLPTAERIGDTALLNHVCQSFSGWPRAALYISRSSIPASSSIARFSALPYALSAAT